MKIGFIKNVSAKVLALIIVILISGVIFSSLAEDLINKETFTTLDPFFGVWLLSQTTLNGDHLFSAITALGSAIFISLSTASLGIWFTIKKDWSKLVFFISAVGGSALLNFVLKNIFQRPRPEFPQAFTIESGFSFPSGHAMISFVFYGAITFLIFSSLKTKWNKVLAACIFLLLTTFIGISRLYIGVHYLTDVVAGWAAGGLWLSICILRLEFFIPTKRRESKPHN